MSYKVVTITPFRQEAKKLIKKYPSLKEELAVLGQQLAQEPTAGIPLGNSCYKVRLSIASKGKGKSGGARIITSVHVAGSTVFLLSIYDKSAQETISDSQLKALLQGIQQ